MKSKFKRLKKQIQLTENARDTSPKRPDLRKINTRHRALMLSMVIHPDWTNGMLAKEHGMSTNNIMILKNSELFMDALKKLQDELDEKELVAKAMRDGVSTDPVRRLAISNAKTAMTGIVDDMKCEDPRIAHTAKLNVLKIAGYQVDKPTDNKIINQNINVSAEAAVQMKLSRSALESMSLKYKEKKRV